MLRGTALFLLVAILGLPTMPGSSAQAASEDAYVLPDATGDVAFTVVTGVATPGLPSAGHLTYMDITSFSLQDVDALTLRVRIETSAGFEPYEDQQVILGSSVYHTFRFQIPGTDAAPTFGILTVYTYWDETALGSSRAIVGGADLCVNTYVGDNYCGFPNLPIEPRFEEGALILDVPKTSLTRSGMFAASYPQLPAKIRTGDALTKIVILSHSQMFGYTTIGGENPGEMRDLVPNSGDAPDFVFTHPSVTDDLQLSLPQVGVVAGEENVVALQIKNLADRKRLLELGLDVEQMDGEWTLTTIPNVTVRARDDVNVTLRITPPVPGNGPLPSVRFQIRARVVTEPGVLAAIPVSLVASDALDRGAHTWYAHTAKPSGGLTGAPVSHDLLTFRQSWASRRENDPTAADQLGAPMYFIGGSNGVDFRAHLVATDGIPNPATLAREDAKAHIVVESPFPMDVTITSTVRTNDVLLAVGAVDATFQRGRNEVDVTMPLDAAATGIAPSDGFLNWEIVLHRPGVDGIPLAFASIADYPDVVPRLSWFDLPLAREVVVPPDPDLPEVSLARAEDADAFVNPGHRTVFEWDVRNEDDQVVELELVIENLSRPWAAEVAPVAHVRLPPAESLRIGAILDAPMVAKEGEICEFRLVLREPGSGRVYAGQGARAIVTDGVEVENETFEVDEAELEALRPPPAKSPGLELIGFLSATVLAVVLGRRRSS